MKKIPFRLLPCLLPLCVFLHSCKEDVPPQTAPPHTPCNAVYYWKTVFQPDSAERRFLAEHEVNRMYIRFFDVVSEDFYRTSKNVVYPSATIQFKDTVPFPVKEVIPTVYITIEALRDSRTTLYSLAGKIVHRVLNMVSYHQIPNVNEIQLDCDWTTSTQQSYFKLCAAVRDSLHAIGNPQMRLSSTIRLHQLNLPAPPVDYGVLMVYNTGSFKNPQARNSILDYSDIKPYLQKDLQYPLPLDVAYPTYNWTLWYRNGQFKGIVRDSSSLSEILPEDILRKETSDFETVSKVKKLVDKRVFKHQAHSVILYHLDSKNLSNYTPNEIEALYTPVAD